MLKLYRAFISPILVNLFGAGCRYQPTCGHYAEDAIAKYGLVRGGKMAVKRVLSCHPFTKRGIIFDPVK